MSEIGIIQAIILGIVQGVTEWLPVSSSGHLSLVQLAMNLEVPVFYDIILHIGSLTGVFAIYRNEITDIIKSIFGSDSKDEKLKDPKGRKMLWLIIIGTIPTAIIGLTFRSFFETSFYDVNFIAIGFIITGILIFTTRFLKGGSKNLGRSDAILIGIGQGISIFSSISRSGATISAGLYRGIDREQLVRYSFLLSIPAILGAMVVDTFTMDDLQRQEIASVPLISYIIGAIVAAIVGYFSIKILIRVVSTGKFYLFAIYCVALGFAVFFLF